jgi:ABC-type amino acid transport system permease subunit
VTLRVLTLGLAIAALIVETSWALLVAMMAGLVLMWGLALIRDADDVATGHAARHAWTSP